MLGIVITAQANILQTQETANRSARNQKFQGHKSSDCPPAEMI